MQLAESHIPLLAELRNRDGFITGNFSLENGEELLRQQFTQVKCFLYPDSLAVTQIDPLVDYLASISPEISELLSPKLSDSFRQYLEEQLEKQGGVIKITKSTGMFVAYK